MEHESPIPEASELGQSDWPAFHRHLQARADVHAPAIIELALKRLDVRPSRAAMVGDTMSTDVAAARAAGVKAILVVDRIHDIPAALVIAPPTLPGLVESLRHVGVMLEPVA